jgi:RNA polymerase sigma factor (sigma-70 family)
MHDEKWNESLRNRLKAIVGRYVRQGSVIDASDIVNSAIVTAYRKRDQFSGKTDAEFYAWLRTIVMNKYHTRSRSERALRRGGGKTVGLGSDVRLDALSREKSPDQLAGEHEVEALLAQLLEHLGEEHAELLYLTNYCEMSHAQIAQKFGLTKNQVTGRMRTATKRMAEAIRELGLEDLCL